MQGCVLYLTDNIPRVVILMDCGTGVRYPNGDCTAELCSQQCMALDVHSDDGDDHCTDPRAGGDYLCACDCFSHTSSNRENYDPDNLAILYYSYTFRDGPMSLQFTQDPVPVADESEG